MCFYEALNGSLSHVTPLEQALLTSGFTVVLGSFVAVLGAVLKEGISYFFFRPNDDYQRVRLMIAEGIVTHASILSSPETNRDDALKMNQDFMKFAAATRTFKHRRHWALWSIPNRQDLQALSELLRDVSKRMSNSAMTDWKDKLEKIQGAIGIDVRDIRIGGN